MADIAGRSASGVSGISHIELRNVTRLFGGHVALRSIDVTFSPGPLTFVQGHNGAGKTTLMAIVGTILRPTKGHVVYAPHGAARQVARRHIGWVAHDSHCYAELSGRENVELAARYYGFEPRAAWEEACERVQAQRFGDQPVGTLSRGQRQRIALARALCHRPSVLLLDEPLTGLDQASVQRMESILLEERDRGTIVIVISHTAGMAERLEGRRIFMQQGRISSIEEP
jgi:heme exporter protein A